jgi:ribosome biogenesis GTPase A
LPHITLPTDELLSHIAKKLSLKSGTNDDLEAAAAVLLKRYRAGDLGRFTLDSVT